MKKLGTGFVMQSTRGNIIDLDGEISQGRVLLIIFTDLGNLSWVLDVLCYKSMENNILRNEETFPGVVMVCELIEEIRIGTRFVM